jgi:hypothetical protein
LLRTKQVFFQKQVFGKGIEQEPLSLSLDAYPFLFLANGGGGSASLEFSNWQIGAIGFSVVPPDFITQTFFNNTDNLKIRRNNAFELFANYYLRKDRKGIYGGVMGGPEWFVMEDKLSGETETIVKSYFVPKLGIRVFPFKRYFYADASFGWSFNLSGTEPRTLGQTTYSATSGGFIYFLQLGARFNLTRSNDKK